MQQTATEFQVFTTNTLSTLYMYILPKLHYVLQMSAPALQAHLDSVAKVVDKSKHTLYYKF